MGRIDKPASQVEGGSDDPLDAQRLQCERDAHDVDDGVRRSDFVEMHVVRGDAVHGAFGFGKLVEDLLRPAADPVGQMRPIEEVPYLPVGTGRRSTVRVVAVAVMNVIVRVILAGAVSLTVVVVMVMVMVMVMVWSWP